MNIGIGSPYREPCGGWTPPYLGPPFQHCNDAENGLPLYANTTQVANYADPAVPPTIGPYARPDPEAHPDCSDNNPPCGPWPEPIPANTYADTGGIQHLSTCEKIGFKIVYAMKGWWGRIGFTSDHDCVIPAIAEGDECYNQPFNGTPIGVKYLTDSTVGTVSSVVLGGENAGHVSGGSTSIVTQTGRYTGKTTVTTVESASEPDFPGDPPTFEQGARDAANVDFHCGQWSGSFLANLLNDPDYALTVGYTSVVFSPPSDSEFEFTITGTFEGQAYTWHGIRTLTDPYSYTDVTADLNTLLATWPINDDLVMPWRTDYLVCGGPLVTYDENLIDSDGYTKTGAIIGAPRAYTDAPYFDFRHRNFTFPGDPPMATLDSYGAWAPGWAPHATQWTDDAQSSALLPGEFRAYNTLVAAGQESHSFGGYLVGSKYAEIITFRVPSHNFARPCGPKDLAEHVGTLQDCTDDGDGGYVDPTGPRRWIGKPCQCNDPSQVEDPSTHVCADPAHPEAVNQWYDTAPKGDWCLMTWLSNFRDVGETLRLISPPFIDALPCCQATPDASPLRPVSGSLAEVIMTPQCAVFCACGPYAVILSSNGETPNYGHTYSDAPALVLDDVYGSLWQRIPRQVMADPLWLPPAKPCTLGVLDPWAEDDGNCNVGQYPQRPYEECRVAPPTGAPALPAGCYMGTMSVADLNAGADGVFIFPPPTGTGTTSGFPLSTFPWNIVLNRKSCVDSEGQFSCDYADVEAVCDDYEP